MGEESLEETAKELLHMLKGKDRITRDLLKGIPRRNRKAVRDWLGTFREELLARILVTIADFLRVHPSPNEEEKQELHRAVEKAMGTLVSEIEEEIRWGDVI